MPTIALSTGVKMKTSSALFTCLSAFCEIYQQVISINLVQRIERLAPFLDTKPIHTRHHSADWGEDDTKLLHVPPYSTVIPSRKAGFTQPNISSLAFCLLEETKQRPVSFCRRENIDLPDENRGRLQILFLLPWQLDRRWAPEVKSLVTYKQVNEMEWTNRGWREGRGGPGWFRVRAEESIGAEHSKAWEVRA